MSLISASSDSSLTFVRCLLNVSVSLQIPRSHAKPLDRTIEPRPIFEWASDKIHDKADKLTEYQYGVLTPQSCRVILPFDAAGSFLSIYVSCLYMFPVHISTEDIRHSPWILRLTAPHHLSSNHYTNKSHARLDQCRYPKGTRP